MRAALDAPIRTTSAVIDQILATGYPAVIVFETPGCGPCQALRPLLDELAHEYEERVLVVRVTDSSEGWLAARWRAALRAHIEFLISRERQPDPAKGPRHTLVARFGAVARGDRLERPRALLFAGEQSP